MADNYLEKQYEAFERKKQTGTQKTHHANSVRLEALTVLVNDVEETSRLLVEVLKAEWRGEWLYLPTLDVMLQLVDSNVDTVQRLEFVFPSKGSRSVYCDALVRRGVSLIVRNDVIELVINASLTIVCKVG